MITVYSNQDEAEENQNNLTKLNGLTEKEVELNIKQGNLQKEKLLSEYIETFLDVYNRKMEENTSSVGANIKVSEVLGGIARLYEKIRTTVEYKGEHVIRRNAIERILKRLVWEQGSIRERTNIKKVAESLIRELIWARYLPNNAVPKSKTDDITEVIDKYIYFLKNLDSVTRDISVSKIRSWIWGIASSEIEDLLDPSYRELFVRLMYEWFNDNFIWDDSSFSEHDRNIQIYLAIHRAYMKSDEPIMRYNLLLKEIPGWGKANLEEVNKLLLNFTQIYTEIESHLNFPSRHSLYRMMQKHTAAFDIFHEIALQEKHSLLSLLRDKQKFSDRIKEICAIKYNQIRDKVNTGIVRSIVYLFITKVIFAMLIEIPYEILRFNEVRYIPLGINIMLPPFLMWLIGMSTRIPGVRNTESILSRLVSVVYYNERKSKQSISVLSSHRNKALSGVFGFIYFLLFIAIFGSVAYLLSLLNFSIFGVMIFFMFLSLVTLFAFRIRYNAVSLKVDSEQESIFGHFSNFLMLPFLNAGFFLSRGLSKINFFSVLLDFIIEAPLKSIIEIFEEWTSFIREKKEEVIELPEQ